MAQQKKIFIQGMTCAACEANIGYELKKISTLDNVRVSLKSGSAEMTFSGDRFPLAEVKQKVEALGYKVSEQPTASTIKKRATGEQWTYAVLLVFGLYLIYKYLSWIGLLDWLNFNPTSVNFGAAFLIGIVASVSTCLVVVGAVVLSFGSKYRATGNLFQSSIKPHLLFHFGRLISFFLLGGVLGMLGSWFNVSTALTGWFTIFIALVLLWLALNILGFVPSLSVIGLRMPKKSLAVWHRLQASQHTLAPAILGAFTFFLPCGFTQSMQLLAIASGNFWTGALTMFLFALGTLPVLFGLGIASSRLSNRRSIVMQIAIGIIILLFAFYTIVAGLAILGFNVGLRPTGKTGTVINEANAQVVNMVVDYAGYDPSTFRIKKDVPVRWVIDGQAISGCTQDIIIPSLGIRQRLKIGENIIEFTPNKKGNLAFSCGMGMVRGNFIVE